MSPKRRKVPTPSSVPKSPIIPKEVADELPVAFEFSLFHAQSVRQGDFHNFCEDRKAALAQIRDLFRTFRDLSQHRRKELESRPLCEQLHWCRIREGKPIDRINNVLAKAYHIAKDTIKEFENEYIEFSCSNGQRVICVAHDNVIVPLFLDPNHLICQEGSSREVKRKMSWAYPLFLHDDGRCDEKIISEDDETRKIILDGIKQGEYTSIAEVQQIIDEFGI